MEKLRGIVRSIRAHTLEVLAGGQIYRCGFRGKVKRERRDARKVAAVGDQVEFEPQAGNEGAIGKVLPRRNRLSRPDPQKRWREQVIVANVDRLLVVHSLKTPDLDLLTVDKCLVMGEASEIPTGLVLTKTDLGEPPDLTFYERVGIPVFRVSSTKKTGLEELADSFRDRTTVLLGPSGVGKSSIINALEPGLDLKVGEVSDRTGEGRHTTSWVEIVDVRGGRVVDTPGLEHFDFWKLTPGRLSGCFPAFADRGCRFRDCAHDREPDCGVKAALEAGEIAPSRHESYLEIRKILLEKGVAFPGAAPPRRPQGRGKEEPPPIPREYR